MTFALNTLLWVLIMLSGNLVLMSVGIACRDGLKRNWLSFSSCLFCAVVFGWLHFICFKAFVN